MGGNLVWDKLGHFWFLNLSSQCFTGLAVFLGELRAIFPFPQAPNQLLHTSLWLETKMTFSKP